MKAIAIRATAAALIATVAGAGSVSAATMTAAFRNMTTDTQTVRSSNYDNYPTDVIAAAGTGSGSYSTSSNPNVTANATYRSVTANLGCFFTAQAVYNSQRARYTFSSAAQSVGVSGGVQATCTSQITSSNSTTGNFNVTYSISGF